MESLAYSALLTPFPQIPSVQIPNAHTPGVVWKNQFSRVALVGSTAGLLISSTLPAGAIVVQGSTCDAVKDIQEALTTKKYDVGGVDGIFGSKTYAAIVKFQTDQKLEADGIVGATCEASTSPEPSTGSGTNQAIRKQQYTVTAEALNIRSGPDTSNDIVDVLFKGDEVEAIPSPTGWLEIEKGKWISSRFVTQKSSTGSTGSTTGSTTVSTENTAKSDDTSGSPSSGSQVPTEIKPGADDSLEEAQKPEIINIKDLDPALTTGYIQVVAEALNVRSEPNTGDNVVGYIAKNEIMPLSGNATKDGWIQVAWGDWISSAFVQPVIIEN
jgi:peptidoglycan hydrolase-like protein with peptidoglycan-binding domain